MGGGRSIGSFQLPLVTTATTAVVEIVILVLVRWVGLTASKVESLGVCQWVRIETTKVLQEMDPP